MKIGILGNEDSWYVADLTRAGAKSGHSCERIQFQRIAATCGMRSEELPRLASGDSDLTGFDVVIVRTMPPGSLEQVVFRMDALATLVANGVSVINSPRSMECAVDKYLTTAMLERAGLNVPRTVTCQDSEAAMAAFEWLGRDVVVKPLFGSEGRGICRVSDPDLAFRTFRTLERTASALYLQEFVHHGGFDIRILVLDGRVIGGMRRSANDDFRTNVARTASTSRHEPTDAEVQTAISAAECIGARIAGVDLLYDQHGNCLVIEDNAVPGWRAFNRTLELDVASMLITSIEQK